MCPTRNCQDEQESDECSSENIQDQKVQIRKPKIERIDKFKTLKKIVINISMTQYPVVSDVAEELGWKIQSSNDAGDWDIYWTDFAIDPDVLIKMHLFQKINHYPGIHVIARKNLLGLGLMAMRSKFPQEYNFFPLTWMLPHQYAEFRAYYEDKPKGKTRTYIAKPEADCQGRGIFLTRKIEELENGKHYVIQRYVARPYLLDNLKFDLRIYVLLCGTNPMRLYIYNEGLARLATETYVEPNISNLQRQYMHLTNYAINKNNPKFVFNSNTSNMGIGHKRSLTAVFKQLAARGINIPQLKQKIHDLTIKTIITGLPLMSHQYKCSQPEDYSGSMCFHILGLDVMLNSKGDPLLIQVNHTPSFTTDTPLDFKIKFNLIKDTLTLLNINVKQKLELITHTKEINKERLLTGKRHIFEGKEREVLIEEALHLRDEYQEKNLGGFEKIYPCMDVDKMKKYEMLIDSAVKSYFEDNGSIRMKMEEKQAKKMYRSDVRRMQQSKQAMQLSKTTVKNLHPKSEQVIPVQNSTTYNLKNLKDIVREDSPNEEESVVEDLTRSETAMINNAPDPQFAKRNSERSKQVDNPNLMQSIQTDVRKNYHEQLDIKVSNIVPFQKDSTADGQGHSAKEKQFRGHDTKFQSNYFDKAKSHVLAGKVKIQKRTLHRAMHQLPNILDTVNNNIDSPLQLLRKRTDHPIPQRRQQSNPKSKNFSQKMARELQQLMDKRIVRTTKSNGGYVMPKIFCLNIEAERRFQQSSFVNLLRKVHRSEQRERQQ